MPILGRGTKRGRVACLRRIGAEEGEGEEAGFALGEEGEGVWGCGAHFGGGREWCLVGLVGVGLGW